MVLGAGSNMTGFDVRCCKCHSCNSRGEGCGAYDSCGKQAAVGRIAWHAGARASSAEPGSAIRGRSPRDGPTAGRPAGSSPQDGALVTDQAFGYAPP